MGATPWFWNRLARMYSRQQISDVAAYEAKLEKTREYFTPDSVVLDLGCGTGTTAIAHAPFVKHIRAVDFSKKMVAIAREKAREAGVENVDFEIATIDDITPIDGGYDVAMAMSVLHLLDNRRDVIGKVFDLLKPDGIFVSSTVCINNPSGLLRFLLPVGGKLGLMPTLNFVTKEQLIGEFRDAGFEIEHEWQPKERAAVFVIARKPG